MKAEAPILRCTGWAGLISGLAHNPQLTGLGALRLDLASAVLAAPAAVALGIASFAPQLARNDRLSVLVIGAETIDAPDHGRWYQAMGPMLDIDADVRVTLVGTELDTVFASAAAGLVPRVPASCARMGLAEFLDSLPDARFDVAVTFQPGFQKHRRWLEDPALARLLANGTQLLGSSAAEDEFQVERWVLESYGYQVCDQPVSSPFFLELGDANSLIRWASVLWRIEAAPHAGHCPDADRLEALDRLTRMVRHSMTVVGVPAPAPGALVEMTASNGERHELLHIFDGRFVDRRDGTLLELTRQSALKSIGRLPAGEVAGFPFGATRDIERAVWAAGIKERHLLGTYERREDADEGAALTRAMLDAMRTRAANLFR